LELAALRPNLRPVDPATLSSPNAVVLRDALWEHCRNGLGIARLLTREARPEAFVASACHLAVESACRAALAHAGLPYDGDVEHALRRLAAPRDLWPGGLDDRLRSAEHVVAWVANYLRGVAPERSWGY
jgi:hypothetical protein